VSSSATARLLGSVVEPTVWHRRHWVELDSEHDVGQVQLGITP
jgi:hypothetical protein